MRTASRTALCPAQPWPRAPLVLAFLLGLWATILAAAAGAAPPMLGVISVTPTGPSDRVTQVTVQFSEPVVPLGRMERDARDVPIEVVCPGGTPRGAYRWIDPKTIGYLLDKPLPPSTGCTVLVRQGTRALSGAVLAADVRSELETKRVELVRSQPWEGAANQPLEPEFTLTFNQPVRAAALAAHLRFVYMGGATGARVSDVAEEAKLPVDAERSYLVRPAAALPKDTAIELRIAPGVPSAAGPLLSIEEKALAFRTYGPFRVVALGCDATCRPGCDPDGPLFVEFSTPVANATARAHLRIAGRESAEGAKAKAESAKGTVAPGEVAPGDDDGVAFEGEVTRVYLPGPWQPRSTATVTVGAGLADAFGQTLAAPVALTAGVGARWPIHDLGGRLGVFEARSDHRLPLLLRNVPDLVLRTKRLEKDAIIPFVRAKRVLNDWDQSGDSLAGVTGVKTTPLGPWGRPDVATYRPLDLDRLVTGGPKGALVYLDVSSREVAASWTCEKQSRWEKALVQVTDIALSVKFGKADTLLLATSLRDATPLPGTRVELRSADNDVLWRGETGPDGVAVAPGEDALLGPDRDEEIPALWAFAERDGDLAFVNTGWQRGIEPWAFGLPYLWPGAPRARAHTVTESPIYRPGETVHFRTLVRRLVPDGLVAPEPASRLVVRVTDSQGETVHEKEYAVSRYGSVHGELALASSAHLGYYRVEALLGGASGDPVDAGSFLVEEYRPATVKLEVEESKVTAATAGHVPGDCAAFDVRARYHFGGPVTEGEAKATLVAAPTFVRLDALEGYAYGEPYRKETSFRPPERQQLAAMDLPLAKEGTASYETALAPTAEPQAIVFEAELAAADGRPVAARARLTLHPSDVYLGLRPKRFGVAASRPLEIDLLAVHRDGRAAPATSVEVEVYRRVWNVVRRKGVGSFYAYDSHVEDTLVDAMTLATADLPVTFATLPARAGTYLVVARARDGRGNRAESTTSFYVWGGDVAGFERYDHDRIDVVPDRASYLPGETAKVLVKSPFEEATALVTIEREGVERFELRCIQGSAVLLEVPIEAGDAPTAFVSVLLLRGRIEESPGAGGVDLGRPQMRLGYATLAVRAPDRRLEVRVEPHRAELRPGDVATVDLRVADLRGERAELTVLALDEAVLDVAGSAPWDPFSVFWADRSLGVSTSDTRLNVIGRRHFGQKGEKLGGGGGGEGEVFRRDFKASAFFAAAVETDAEGSARVTFKLPDNLTTFRVVALAATRRDRFGTGEARLLVTKPLVLTPSVARFLEVGDRAQVGVVVHNRTGKDGVAEVALDARGVALEGAKTARTAIAAGASAELVFSVRAAREGRAELRFTATIGTESDALAVAVPVEDRAPADVFASYGTTTEPLTAATLLVPGSARGDRGGLEVAVSSSLAGGLRGPVEWMRRYPYDCLEQRLSRAVTYVAAARYPGRIGIAGKARDETSAYATWAVRELATFQEESGLFAYWPGAYADPYLTGWALEATRVLGAWGVPADAAVRARAADAALLVVREDRWPWWYSEEAKRETRAFLLAQLAREGKLETALLERSTAERLKLSVFGLASLLDATAEKRGIEAPEYDAVRSALLAHEVVTAREVSFEEVRDDGLKAVLSSPVRGNAMALRVLASREPAWPGVPSLARWLVLGEKAGRWDTTHEVAWGMIAAATYLDAYEKEPPAFTVTAKVAGKAMGSSTFERFEAAPLVHALSLAEVPRDRPVSLDLEKKGEGRLYWTMRLRIADASPTAEPASSGLQVERRLERPDGRTIDPGEGIARGETLRVVVTLTAPSLRHFVVLEDPLPAGFEAVNFRLATTTGSAGELYGKDADNAWIAHEELRDDRAVAYTQWVEPGTHTFTYLARATTSGRFLAPAPHAEEMYAPETYGRGRPAIVVVRSAEPIAAAAGATGTEPRQERRWQEIP